MCGRELICPRAICCCLHSPLAKDNWNPGPISFRQSDYLGMKCTSCSLCTCSGICPCSTSHFYIRPVKYIIVTLVCTFGINCNCPCLQGPSVPWQGPLPGVSPCCVCFVCILPATSRLWSVYLYGVRNCYVNAALLLLSKHSCVLTELVAAQLTISTQINILGLFSLATMVLCSGHNSEATWQVWHTIATMPGSGYVCCN